MKAWRKRSGDERFIHIEAQMTPEGEFPLRMHRYGCRGRDRFGKPLIALAILGDDDPKWHPTEYREGELESETVFKFRSVKLLDLRPRMAELEAGKNLFGLFIVAHLETIATKKDVEGRSRAKYRLLCNLLARNLEAVEEARWVRLLDWLMRLPVEYNRAMWDELRKIRGDAMPYVTSIERIGHERGLAEGLRAMLRVKFKEQGASLADRVVISDAVELETLLGKVAEADTLEKARAALGLDD